MNQRRLLIVSPHFPPVNAPDMQRVRMSLPYFREFGWQPYVLAVAPSDDAPLEPLLLDTLPKDVHIERVGSVPLGLSRAFGVGNVALRALPCLYRAGARLIANEHIDLVYFSTTMFLSMPLGRMWKRALGVPYVLDIQDPWLSDYYEQHPGSAPPPKYAIARRVHAVMEPWTMKNVGAVIAVSDAYVDTLRRRYRWLTGSMCTTLPFAASTRDFELLRTNPQPNRSFTPRDGRIHGVYVGRGGDDMKPALWTLFSSLRDSRTGSPDALRSIRLHFVGTDYATDGRARHTVKPVADAVGIGGLVEEQTDRVPYFEALQLMADSDFLVLAGSDDAAYTASKVYPYLLAHKPILAIVHERSGLVPLLKESPAAIVVTFTSGREDVASGDLQEAWRTLVERVGRPVSVPADVLTRCSAHEMTRRQCQVFDRVRAEATA